MLLTFECIIILLILIDYHTQKKLITPFTSIALPYVLLIPINNIWGVKYGFFAIADNVIKMIGLGLFLFSLGSLLASIRKRRNKTEVLWAENNNIDKVIYDYNGIYTYLFIVNLFGTIRFIRGFLQGGVSFFFSNEGYMLSGLTGHLYLSAFSLVPIAIYSLLSYKEYRRLSYIITVLASILFIFLSLVKYQVISLVLISYVFVCFKNRTYIKKGFIVIFGIVIVLFVANYIMDFWIHHTSVNQDFYYLHFWKYACGSIIHDNEIFTHGFNNSMSGLYKLGVLTSSFPNMFLYGLLGEKVLFDAIKTDVGYSAISSVGESTNVIDFIGFVYPSNKAFEGYIMFGIIMIGLGYIASLMYNRGFRKNQSDYSSIISSIVFLVYFCLLSFFGVYATLSSTWEILFLSFFMPNLFRYGSKYRIKMPRFQRIRITKKRLQRQERPHKHMM